MLWLRERWEQLIGVLVCGTLTYDLIIGYTLPAANYEECQKIWLWGIGLVTGLGAGFALLRILGEEGPSYAARRRYQLMMLGVAALVFTAGQYLPTGAVRFVGAIVGAWVTWGGVRTLFSLGE